MVWAIGHYRAYLYGHNVTVYTDHSAVKAVLGATNLSGKHARWWTKVYGNGLGAIDIVYRSGKENSNADALSRTPLWCPCQADPLHGEPFCEVLAVQAEGRQPFQTITGLLEDPPAEDTSLSPVDLAEEQRKDPSLASLIQYLTDGTLPQDPCESKLLVAKAPSFALIDKFLYHIDIKQRQIKQVVVPTHLRHKIMQDYHQGRMSGHFSGPRLFRTISRTWRWERMFTDITEFCSSCPQCRIAMGTGKTLRPPLHPIPVHQLFQIV